MSKCCVLFIMRARHRGRQTRRTERPALCPSSLWPSARPAPTEEEREREGALCVCVCVLEWGKHFPGRIPRTRRRAGFSRWRRGCVPGSQLAACIYTTNGAPMVSPALTWARTHHSWMHPLCAHQHTPTQGQRDGEGGREREEEASYPLEWHSSNTNSVTIKNTGTSGKHTK